METLNYIGIILFILSLIGYYYARMHKDARHRFSWVGFFTIITLPLFYVIYLAYVFGYKILLLFLVSAVVGILLEYHLGSVYYKLEGKKFWQYSQYTLKGYISWLCIPIWGIAGVIFWSLSKLVGL